MKTISLPDQGTAPHGNIGVAVGDIIKYPEVSSCLTITLIDKGNPPIFGGVHIAMTVQETVTSRSEILRYLMAANRMFREALQANRNQPPQRVECAWIVGHIDVWENSEAPKVQNNLSFIRTWLRARVNHVNEIDVEHTVDDLRINMAKRKFAVPPNTPMMERVKILSKRNTEAQRLRAHQKSVDIVFNPISRRGVIQDRKVAGPAHGWAF